MSLRLFVAEKPAVAKDLAAALGARGQAIRCTDWELSLDSPSLRGMDRKAGIEVHDANGPTPSTQG